MEIRVLGPIEAADDAGAPVLLGGERARRLIAALATQHDQPIRAERLMDIVWPDGAPGGGVSTLQVLISRLRSSLGRLVIVSTPDGYALSRASTTLDIERFQTLISTARESDPAAAIGHFNSALALWRGPAFGDLGGEWWARPTAERLEEIRLAALGERIDALLACGSHAEAVAETGVLVAAHPVHEGFVRQRMRALHLDGRSTEALRTAASFRHRLAETSGLDPGPGLTTLEQQILDHDPGLATEQPKTMRGYQLGELLAEGAQGAVYVAYQESLGRQVAIKILRRHRADDLDFVRRFEGEAQLVAQLEHPGIVPLYDFWREPGAAYLVFRLLRGGTLAAKLASGRPVTLADVDVLVGRIGDALITAHRRGVVHRDVSPANILLDEAGHPYLTDFGIASEIDGAESDLGDEGEADDAVGLAESALAMLSQVRAADRRSSTPLFRLLNRFTSSPDPRVGDLVTAWEDLRAAAGARPELTSPARVQDSTNAENPFKGLRPFGEADRSQFFGREHPIAETLERLTDTRLVCLVGPSGCGKSSIAHAGLAPELRERGHVVTSMTPGVRPLWSLTAALQRIATAAQADSFADPSGLLSRLAVELPLVLIIDQLEELWTVSVDSDVEALSMAIRDALTIEGSQLRVLMTLRADFFDRPLADPHIGAAIAAGSLPIGPLDPVDVERAIANPLASSGVSLEPGLLPLLLAAWAREPAALPQLQLLLAALYDRRLDQRLTIAAHDELGGIDGVVTAAAEDVFGQLSPAHQADVRKAFETLVVVGDSREYDVRRRVARRELIADEALEMLGAVRLVTFDRSPESGEPTVQVAHESLLSGWPRLRMWIDESRERLQAQRVTSEAAMAWARADRDPSHLLRGSRLAASEQIDRADLTPLEGEFVHASQAAMTLERRKQRSHLIATQLLLAAVAGLLVLALVAAAVARSERTDARNSAQEARTQEQAAELNAREADIAADDAQEARRTADIRRVVFEARAIAPGDTDLGLLLAAEATHLQPGVEADSALLSALVANPAIDRVIDLGLASDDGVTAIAGRVPGPLVVATPERVVVVDGTTLVPTGIGWTVDGVASLAVNPSGTEAVVVTRSGRAERRDLATGDRIGSSWTVAPAIQVEQAAPVAYLADGTLAVADGTELKLLPPSTVGLERTVEVGAPITVLEASPVEDLLVVSSFAPGPDATFVLEAGSDDTRPIGPTAFAAAIGPDGIVDVSTIGGVARFDLSTAEELGRGRSATAVTVDLLALPDGRTLQMGLVRHLAIAGPDLVASRIDTSGAPLVLGAALPDGRAVVGSGHRLLVLDPDAVPMPLEQLDVDGVVVPRRFGDHVVSSGPDGAQLLDASSFEPVGPLIPALRSLGRGAISANDDATLVAGVVGGGVQVYETRTGRLVGEVRTGIIGPVLLSPGGTHLAASTPTGVSIFAVPSMEPMHEIAVAGGLPAYLAWSPGEDEVWYVDLATRGHRIDPVAGTATATGGGTAVYSTSGTFRLQFGFDGEPIRIFDRETDLVSLTLDGLREVAAGALFADDRRLARAVSVEGVVDLIDLDSGARIGDPIEPLTSGEELFSPVLAVSDDGKTLLIGQVGVSLQRLELDPEVWLDMACAGAGRNLTRAEWAQYFGSIGAYHRTCPQYPDGR